MVASVMMGVIAKAMYNMLMGALVCFVIIYFMKIEEVDSLIGMVKGKIRKV